MDFYSVDGGHIGHHQPHSPNGWHHASSRPHTLLGETFEGFPFTVQLSSDNAFDHGASAGIHRGVSSWGPWSHPPLVVAVKVFGHMLKLTQQQLLLRELWIASQASLRHPLILPFLGTVDNGNQKSLVSLYMRNGNLLEFLKAYPGCNKKNLLLQVAEAVNYLHNYAQLVHGDLKCENILISDSGDALLADFGLSTFVEKSQSDATTMTGIREMNTVRFAAPELLQGTDDPTVRPRSKTIESDVYAFGMLILQAVTELQPWPGQTTLAVIHNICQGLHPPRPTFHGFVTISHSWWDVCRNCWSPKPGDRPSMHTVWSLLRDAALEPHRWLEGHTGAVYSVAYFPEGRRVVSGSQDGTIRIWDTPTGRTVVGPLHGHDSPVSSVAVSPDGRQICACSEHRTIHRWNAKSGAPMGEPMAGHDRDVRAVAFSPNGTRIVSCSDDKTVRLWDAATGAALGNPLAGHTDRIQSVAFSPGGVGIASGSDDGTIRLWDSTTGGSSGVLPDAGPRVFSVCFAPDRIHLVSGSTDGTMRIWNIATRQHEREHYVYSHPITSVAVSPSGKYIVSGSYDKTIRIWDAETWEAVGPPLIGHSDWICSLTFSPDGRSLVSASNDRTLRVWDLFE